MGGRGSGKSAAVRRREEASLPAMRKTRCSSYRVDILGTKFPVNQDEATLKKEYKTRTNEIWWKWHPGLDPGTVLMYERKQDSHTVAAKFSHHLQLTKRVSSSLGSNYIVEGDLELLTPGLFQV
ncbi:hypothetical protein STEG23_001368 [Scotinomys teguina]